MPEICGPKVCRSDCDMQSVCCHFQFPHHHDHEETENDTN